MLMSPFSTPWCLVSPASRGLGLQFARHVLQSTNVPVVATARNDLETTKGAILHGLDGIGRDRLRVLEVDVLDESTISSAVESCAVRFPPSSHHLHFSVILPGLLFPEKSPHQISGNNALLAFRTNAIGPLLMLKHFSTLLPTKRTLLPTPALPQDIPGASSLYANLPPHSTTAILSARVGSISDNELGGWYTYRASKAAVNQIVKTFDIHLRRTAGDKAMAVALHPGTVKTTLSSKFWDSVERGGGRLFEAEWAAKRLCAVLGVGGDGGLREGKADGGGGVRGKAVGLDGRGRVLDWKGEEIMP